jgi:hypothetical protein
MTAELIDGFPVYPGAVVLLDDPQPHGVRSGFFREAKRCKLLHQKMLSMGGGLLATHDLIESDNKLQTVIIRLIDPQSLFDVY